MISILFFGIIKHIVNSSAMKTVVTIAVMAVLVFGAILLARYAVGKRKYGFLLLEVLFLVELCTSAMFLSPKQVTLEFVGCTESTQTVEDGAPVLWYTSISPDMKKEQIEERLSCSLDGIRFDPAEYHYLFVYGHESVSLSYSFWDLSFDNLIPPQEAFFLGSLSASDAQKEGFVYVFRFRKVPIVPHELQWK